MSMEAEKVSIAKGKERTLFLESASSASYSISLAEGAKAEIAIVNIAPEETDVEIKVEAMVGKNAALKLIGCTLGGRETRSEVKISQQAGSRCEHFEVALLSGAQRLIARTKHLHCAPGSFSRSSFRFAAAGSAQADVQGGVEIAQKAARADAHFVAKSLLLSREARVRVVPMLSVKTGDALAGHGAAMAPFSADELFYLQSRGIEDNEGRRMILDGFLLEFEARQMGMIRAAVGRKIGDIYGI
ncbi:MAG: SufD family Fe-S cluster assembly protein [Candidatus Micrarchaeota archaeon]|nr:SufD family Fe-S cluster assembly protein [Candidatus Micrarchaeota archaeon]